MRAQQLAAMPEALEEAQGHLAVLSDSCAPCVPSAVRDVHLSRELDSITVLRQPLLCIDAGDFSAISALHEHGQRLGIVLNAVPHHNLVNQLREVNFHLTPF